MDHHKTQPQQHVQHRPSASTSNTALSTPATTGDTSRDRDKKAPQLYVWVVTINREVTNEEFQRYMSAIDPTLRKALEPSIGRKQNLSTLRKVVADLLPRLLMMRQRIPKSMWTFESNKDGKWYIDSPPQPSGRAAAKVMGFGLAERDSLIGMAFAQGRKHEVVNVGMDIVRIPDYRDNQDAETYIASLMHKLAPEELSSIVPALPVDKKLSRLCIMLAIKEAYLKALGQPPGFDLSRIAVVINPGLGTTGLKVDRKSVNGWEFRLFTAEIGVERAGTGAGAGERDPDSPEVNVYGRPTDPDPRSRRKSPAPATNTSTKLMAGGGPAVGVPGGSRAGGGTGLGHQQMPSLSSAMASKPTRMNSVPSYSATSSSSAKPAAPVRGASVPMLGRTDSMDVDEDPTPQPTPRASADSAGVAGGVDPIVKEKYQCATAIWRGWADRSEIIFTERDKDDMSSWLQFLTVRTLAKVVGSGGEGGTETM